MALWAIVACIRGVEMSGGLVWLTPSASHLLIVLKLGLAGLPPSCPAWTSFRLPFSRFLGPLGALNVDSGGEGGGRGAKEGGEVEGKEEMWTISGPILRRPALLPVPPAQSEQIFCRERPLAIGHQSAIKSASSSLSIVIRHTDLWGRVCNGSACFLTGKSTGIYSY